MYGMEVHLLHLHRFPGSQTTGVLHCLIKTSYDSHQDSWHSAGPIRTEIWDDLIGNAEPVADSGSLFARHVQAAHALSVTETSKRSWFWEPEVVGKRVWKVSPLASLHASAIGWDHLGRRREGLLHVIKGGPTTRIRFGPLKTSTLALPLAYHRCQCGL